MSEFLGISAAAVLLLYGGSLVLDGRLEAAGFIAYLAIFTQITRPVRSFTDAFSNINQGIAAGDRVLGLLDEKSRIPEATGAVRLEQFRDSIEFRDVSFSYDDSRKVIDSVSFTIRKGETVALVGPSGGGKSTLSDLIPRFYDVTSGAIFVDGIDLREYQLDSLRSHMGIVTQETILFNDTFAAQGAHVAGNRAPPEHDRGRRQDHRDRARPDRRTGYAPRIDGARRHLRTPDRNAATRVKPSGAPETGTNPSGANSNTDSLRFPATFLYL